MIIFGLVAFMAQWADLIEKATSCTTYQIYIYMYQHQSKRKDWYTKQVQLMYVFFSLILYRRKY